MSITRKEIADFFSDYAAALSARDLKNIVRCWGVPALVLSDHGVIAVSELEEVEAFFASSMRQYDKVASAHPTFQSVIPLSDTVVGCQIAWEHRDQNGNSVGGEAGYYMLKRDDEALHIHVYVPRLAE